MSNPETISYTKRQSDGTWVRVPVDTYECLIALRLLEEAIVPGKSLDESAAKECVRDAYSVEEVED